MKRFALPLLAVFLLAGCAATEPMSAQEKPEQVATYATVVDLRDAFVEAGGDCPEWEPTNRVALAAESGECSGNTVLSTYASESSRDQVVSDLKSIALDGVNLLVGENWIINTPTPSDYVDTLGGTVVTS
jgi:hypothetical protein